MSFVSYAQNYEDVMLRRALKDVRQGFYIDVGAQDPVADSVTRVFYEHGWRGINIEPVESWHRKLMEDRPDDINLRIALGKAAGEATLYEFPGTGLSTSDSGFAKQHQEAGRTAVTHRVPVSTLDAVCGEHGVTHIHFLKIDVEGAERDVLEGYSFAVRPWIVLVEATLPNSQVPSHGEWEGLLTGRGYRFVYSDGLNRFYLDEAHAELAEAFATPPNVFDQFVRYPEWRAEVELHQAREEHQRLAGTLGLAEARERAASAEAERDAARSMLEAREAMLSALAAANEAERRVAAELALELRGRVDAMAARMASSEEAAKTLEGRLAGAEGERDQALRSAAGLAQQVAALESELLAAGQELRSAADLRDRTLLELEVLRLDASRVPLLEADLASLRIEMEAQEIKASQSACEAASLRHDMQVILRSHSWRITRPLRHARRKLSLGYALGRRLAARVIRMPLRLAASIGPVRALGRRLLANHPGLAQRLLRLSGRLPDLAPALPAELPDHRVPRGELTPRAQAVLRALRAAAPEHGRNGPAED